MCWKKCYIYFFKFNENTFSYVSRVIYWQRCLDFHFKLKKIYHFLFACNDKSFNSCTIQYQYNGLRWRRATILINFYCIIVFRHQHKEIEAHTSFSQCFIDQRIQLFPSVISLHLLLIFLNNNNKWTKKAKNIILLWCLWSILKVDAMERCTTHQNIHVRFYGFTTLEKYSFFCKFLFLLFPCKNQF